MTVRSEMLEFLSAIKNEIDMAEVDPDESQFADEPQIISKMMAAVAAIEHIYPMICAIDEVICGDITPKLFHRKWISIAAHMNIDDGIGAEDISKDVKDLLGKFDSNLDAEGEEA